MMPNANPTGRFSNRVADYVRYRPGYPKEVIALLQKECGLTRQSVIADIGSGTGLLTELFLKNGNKVYGVEPNREMREAGDRLLKAYPGFVSVAGAAEETTLADESVDMIVAGQAFHWFDRACCRVEFGRILKPGGWIVLVWNDRRTKTTPFLGEYEQLLQTYGTDYTDVNHRRIDSNVVEGFFGAKPREAKFPNHQYFDFTGLRGRLLSSSYVPAAGEPKHDEMLSALEKLYAKHQNKDQVVVEYDTVTFYGQLLC